MNWLAPLGFFAAIIAIWEFFVHIFSVPQYLLPAPSAIFIDMITNLDSLLFHAGVTFWEAFLGFLLANVLGVLVAILFAHSRLFERGLSPFVIALQTTPLLAMAPLIILWLGTGIISKVVTAALIAFFPAVVNTLKGLRSVDSEALDLFRSLSATKWQIFSKLRCWSAMPFIFSALKISTSLAVVGAIISEFVGANEGIGFVILISSYHLEMVRMFSAVIAAALMGVAFYWTVSFIERRVVFWMVSDER